MVLKGQQSVSTETPSSDTSLSGFIPSSSSLIKQAFDRATLSHPKYFIHMFYDNDATLTDKAAEAIAQELKNMGYWVDKAAF